MCFIQDKFCHLLYNAELLAKPDACLLNSDILTQADQVKRVENGGRGQAWFMMFDHLSAVYRQYQRGGLVAKANQQTYFSLNIERTRSVSEWRLLDKMYEMGLPVPQPIAAGVSRWPFAFSPFYRAQILVSRIADVQTLDQLLVKQALTDSQWKSIGQCVRKFHSAGVYHADLNANNILLNGEGKVYLIDFDKSELRDKSRNKQNSTTTWMQENLLRLKRSLLKQQGIHSTYFFTDDSWSAIVSGYGR